jgi:tryptophan 2,3-dioxygenase
MPPLTYASYLDLEKLISLQKPRSSPPEHDETLFIIIHQTYELWFKQVLHEFDKIKRDFSAGDLFGAIHTFKRVRTIMKVLVAQVDILETMTPSSFSSFRDRLETASGFQSVQFREIEFTLGYKRASTVNYLKPDFPGYDRLRQRLHERTVVDHFYDFLETRGAQIPTELKNRDVTQPNGPDQRVQGEILRLYKNSPECSILFELMTDFDEGLQEWRYRHVKLAGCALFERIIIQTGLSRSLGNPARNVTAAQSCLGMTKHECRVELITVGEIRAPSRKTIALSLFREASWSRLVFPDAFRLTRTGNPNRMRCVLRRTI